MGRETASPEHLAAGKSSDAGDLITRRRYRLVQSLAPPSGRVLLDFGCGNGGQTFLFAAHFNIVLGIDVSEEYLETFHREAAKRGLANQAFAVQSDGSRLPLANGSVDYAVSFEVLEHVESEQKALSELHRVIRPGGTLAMSVPNRWWVFETHGAALPVLRWNRVPFFSWLPKKIHDRYAHARIYRRREIIEKITKSGFRVTHSAYITAPMDVVKQAFVQRALRETIFRGDRTVFPCLATAVLVVAIRQNY